MVYWV
jgi:hypothetical protein